MTYNWRANPDIKFWRGRDGTHDMRGENARSAKLTVQAAARIKAAPPEVTTSALAREYGVTHTTIKRVRDGVTWAHVDPGTWTESNG